MSIKKSLRCIFVHLVLILLSNDIYAEKNILSLQDAILLSVRDNANVQSAKLNLLLSTYQLQIEQWQFMPHYAFKASASFNQSKVFAGEPLSSRTYNIQPEVSLLTPIGTQTRMTFANEATKNYNPALSLQISQPLISGFGKPVVEAALNNAKDNEYISRLQIQNTLKNTITSVINAYLNLIAAQKMVEIDSLSLNRAIQSVTQTELFIKGGHKAKNEIFIVKANVASARSLLENDKNNYQQAKYALLETIGLNPQSDISFADLNLEKLMTKFKDISIAETKKLVLLTDIQYQIDRMTIQGSLKRNLLIAEDNNKWKLNLDMNAATGNGSGGGVNAGINSLINGSNQTTNLALSLQVPIDDHVGKQAVMSAKIAIKQAEMNLEQEKWQKEIDAINAYHLVSSAERSLSFAEDAESLQKKTYDINNQKYFHGLIDSLTLQTAQTGLFQAELSKLSSQINYLKALVNLDLIIGHTLATWEITLNPSGLMI